MNALQWLNMTRHGESTGNVAYQAVDGTDAEEAGIPERDPDVPLSDTGRVQAARLGLWLARLPEDERPTLVVASPYVRTVDTARIALAQTSYAAPQDPGGLELKIDERLRDREQGALQGLTAIGVERRFPEEAARLRRLGKFYYRPPGGESWADLALRLRSFYRDLEAEAPGGRVMVVTHDAIVAMTRYLVEDLTERDIMELDEKDPVGNASVTRWRQEGANLQAVCYNDTAHLVNAGVPSR